MRCSRISLWTRTLQVLMSPPCCKISLLTRTLQILMPPLYSEISLLLQKLQTVMPPHCSRISLSPKNCLDVFTLKMNLSVNPDTSGCDVSSNKKYTYLGAVNSRWWWANIVNYTGVRRWRSWSHILAGTEWPGLLITDVRSPLGLVSGGWKVTWQSWNSW